MDDLATSAELRKIGATVGEKQRQKTRLATMLDYLDQMVVLITGGVPDGDASAQVKVDTADRKAAEAIQMLTPKAPGAETAAPKPPQNELVTLLIEQDYAAAVEKFDETMKNTLPPEGLQQLWQATLAQLGPLKEQIDLRTEEDGDYSITFATCRFQNGTMDIKVVYNTDMQIAGLFFVPTPPEILSAYQPPEQPLPEEYSTIQIDDPNTVGLLGVIQKLKARLNNLAKITLATEQRLNELQNRFDDTVAASFEKEQTLLAEKEKFKQQVDDIKQDYDRLRELTEQTAEQQVKTLMNQLDNERDNRKQTHQQLLKTQAQLKMVEDRMKHTQQQLQAIVPPPDTEVAAYKPDGKIILIDNATKIAHLNIGTDDHVYRGLTFSVYEKNMPIPVGGKGKAEIEVFSVGKTFSAARITRSDIRNPIILDDIVANLIWDSQKTNLFVVAGDFDLDGNGQVDFDATAKIEALIQKWGSKVVRNVTIDTDFLVLGSTPAVMRRPTFEQMEVDPMAMEKYQDSLQRLQRYQEVQEQTQKLMIPVFNYERFLYLIGYMEQSARAGAF
ncbi:MAG: DUF3887 domain-containing protein [Planctomycetota bacterium]|jgi:hypothetical protein